MTTVRHCELCGEVAVEEVQITPARIGRAGGKVEVIEQAVTIWVCAFHQTEIWQAPSHQSLRAKRGAWAKFWARRQSRLI